MFSLDSFCGCVCGRFLIRASYLCPSTIKCEISITVDCCDGRVNKFFLVLSFSTPHPQVPPVLHPNPIMCLVDAERRA